MRRLFLVIFFMGIGGIAGAGEFSLTVLPTAHLDYKVAGKIPGYVADFEGSKAPLYRLEWTQTHVPNGYWGLSLWHTGVFGGGTWGQETVPSESAGAVSYQINSLNVGFTNLFVTYHRALFQGPVEAQFHMSVVREIFKRRDFVFPSSGTVATGLDDVNELSAEGMGVGLAGIHGKRFFFRWQTAVHYYVQIFDAQTDASAGSIFQAEGGLGWRASPRFSVELGGLWQDWFILGQGNRRLSVDGTDGAIISYNRQLTTLGGFYVKADWRFGERP